MREPYKQFMFHFQFPNNSIDARDVSPAEMQWAKGIYEQTGNWIKVAEASNGTHTTSSDYKTIKKMFEMWFPEELL